MPAGSVEQHQIILVERPAHLGIGGQPGQHRVLQGNKVRLGERIALGRTGGGWQRQARAEPSFQDRNLSAIGRPPRAVPGTPTQAMLRQEIGQRYAEARKDAVRNLV